MKRVVFFIILCLFSCKPEKERTNIPDAPIYFQIRLSNYTVFTGGIGNVLTCPQDLVSSSDKAGSFGYSGRVLLINDFENRIGAYDACCTSPACVAQKNIVSAGIRAKCPVCGSEFDLSAGGAVVAGSAQYPLRRYRVTISGGILAVSRYAY
ncbi:MAG: hypothetical protein LBN27_13895 [Prevotellaceae bacterium]|jgi:nitrite reductase/ring-hydroxylating ferredoxin subunit|nr:hypothetical protein [Prevotellaceae bacterium]